MKFTTSASLLALVAIASNVFALPHGGSHSTEATSAAAVHDDMDETPGSGGSWTVIVDDDDPRSFDELITELDIDTKTLKHVYNNTAFKGFAGELSSHCVSKMSAMSTGLKVFEPDMDIQLADIQVNAPWGLERVSQGSPIPEPPQDPSELANNDFRYSFQGNLQGLGKDVDIYIIDTGINVEHEDFEGRARWGFTIDGQEVDDEGHGTHCAGTAAGSVWGVSKAANIIAVKVLGKQGKSSDVLMGLDFVLKNHESRKGEANFAGSVASMSLGSASQNPSIDNAVRSATKEGIHFSVAAGNENQPACNSSPANAAGDSAVIAVGATTIDDERAGFSNFGRCATVYAPGQDITSAWIGGTNKINTISGTSMACPHVTGLIAYMLSQDPSLKIDTAAMKQRIIDLSTDLSTDLGIVKFVNNGFLVPTEG